MPLLYHAYVYLEFLILACTIYILAPRCIEAGIEPVVLKGWLGHTNIHTTLDTYTDVFDRMELGAIDNLDEYLTEFDED